MSVGNLQPLLVAGEECKNLLRNFEARGGKCSERLQALVDQISDLCTTLQEHLDAAGSDTLAYAHYPSCQLALQQCYDFIKSYVEKSRSKRVSFRGSAESAFEEKKIESLERKIQWQLAVGGRSAQHDILRRTSIQMPGPSQEVLYEDGDPMSTFDYITPPSPRMDASNYSRPSLLRMNELYQTSGPVAGAESSRLSYQNSLSSNGSSDATSFESTEEYPDTYEETPQQYRASVASPLTSLNVQSICRIMSQDTYEKGVKKGFGKDFKEVMSVGMPSKPKPGKPQPGKPHKDWWQISFMDQNRKPFLRHSISARYSQTCIPYTEWGGWKLPLAVWIHDLDPKNKPIQQQLDYLIKFSGQRELPNGTPRYIFLNPQAAPDKFEAEARKRIFFDFQSIIYGKTLLDIFDIDRIKSSRRGEESSKQQLKIWLDHEGASAANSSITFFANNDHDRRHLKFPLSWFDLESLYAEEREIKLDFLTKSTKNKIKSREKQQFKMEKAETFETQDTRAPSIFSVASSATFESRTSASTSRRSSTSDSSIAMQAEISKTAEQMEYLKIKFTNPPDYYRFQTRLSSIQYGSNPSQSSSPFFNGYAFPTSSPPPSSLAQFEAVASSSSSRMSSSSNGKGKSR